MYSNKDARLAMALFCNKNGAIRLGNSVEVVLSFGTDGRKWYTGEGQVGAKALFLQMFASVIGRPVQL